MNCVKLIRQQWAQLSTETCKLGRNRNYSILFSPRKLSKSQLSSSWTTFLSLNRHILVTADQLRSGMVIEYEGRMYKIESFMALTRPRAPTTITFDLRDIERGTKNPIKIRPADKIERVILESSDMQYLYKTSTTVHLMHPQTFEQVDLPLDFVPKSQLPFLIDNSIIKLVSNNNVPVSIELPSNMRFTVINTERGVERQVAILDNGIKVDVPAMIKPGDSIIIRTGDSTYVSKE